jgi:hypothetical protein
MSDVARAVRLATNLSIGLVLIRPIQIQGSTLIPNCLMIGHHFSASAFTRAPRASGVCSAADSRYCV